MIYSQNFTGGSISTTQCTAWNTFQALLVVTNYTTFTMSGSRDPIGITLSDPVIVNAIAQALRTNTTYGPVSSGGFSWRVNLCGSGYEITSLGTLCGCGTGYTV